MSVPHEFRLRPSAPAASPMQRAVTPARGQISGVREQAPAQAPGAGSSVRERVPLRASSSGPEARRGPGYRRRPPAAPGAASASARLASGAAVSAAVARSRSSASGAAATRADARAPDAPPRGTAARLSDSAARTAHAGLAQATQGRAPPPCACEGLSLAASLWPPRRARHVPAAARPRVKAREKAAQAPAACRCPGEQLERPPCGARAAACSTSRATRAQLGQQGGRGPCPRAYCVVANRCPAPRPQSCFADGGAHGGDPPVSRRAREAASTLQASSTVTAPCAAGGALVEQAHARPAGRRPPAAPAARRASGVELDALLIGDIVAAGRAMSSGRMRLKANRWQRERMVAGHLVQLGGGQNEHQVLRRLLQDLEQGVEGRRARACAPRR